MKHLVRVIVGSVVLLQCVCQESWHKLTTLGSLASKEPPFLESDLNETEHQSQCLKMTYNSTKQIFSLPFFLPPTYNYSVWFMPIKGEEPISIQFDFSLPGTMADFPDHSFSYPVIPWQWHRLEIVAGRHSRTSCKRWAELKIEEIDVETCLPHHTISRIQVSSAENLVMWYTCPAQGKWWEELAGSVKENSHPGVTTYVLAACLAAALIVLATVVVYACYLRTSGQRNPVNEDDVYADWNDLGSKKPVAITPPSSASYNSNTGTINTFLSS